MAEKQVTIEVDAVRGTLRMKGTLFVGGTTEVVFSGYTGLNPALILFRRDASTRQLVPVAKTEQGEDDQGRAVYTINLNTQEAREAFGPRSMALDKAGSRCPMEAYVVDGSDVPGSIDALMNEICARLEEV